MSGQCALEGHRPDHASGDGSGYVYCRCGKACYEWALPVTRFEAVR